MWLFPTGQPHPDDSPRSPSRPAGAGEAFPTPGADQMDGCADLFTVLEAKLQKEFHNMVQVSAAG